jgi:hypothetical protein
MPSFSPVSANPGVAAGLAPLRTCGFDRYVLESEPDSPYMREIPEFASAPGIAHLDSGRPSGRIFALISSTALREAVGEVRENQ